MGRGGSLSVIVSTTVFLLTLRTTLPACISGNAVGCTEIRLENDVCDAQCNSLECGYDDGKCDTLQCTISGHTPMLYFVFAGPYDQETSIPNLAATSEYAQHNAEYLGGIESFEFEYLAGPDLTEGALAIPELDSGFYWTDASVLALIHVPEPDSLEEGTYRTVISSSLWSAALFAVGYVEAAGGYYLGTGDESSGIRSTEIVSYDRWVAIYATRSGVTVWDSKEGDEPMELPVEEDSSPAWRFDASHSQSSFPGSLRHVAIWDQQLTSYMIDDLLSPSTECAVAYVGDVWIDVDDIDPYSYFVVIPIELEDQREGQYIECRRSERDWEECEEEYKLKNSPGLREVFFRGRDALGLIGSEAYHSWYSGYSVVLSHDSLTLDETETATVYLSVPVQMPTNEELQCAASCEGDITIFPTVIVVDRTSSHNVSVSITADENDNVSSTPSDEYVCKFVCQVDGSEDEVDIDEMEVVVSVFDNDSIHQWFAVASDVVMDEGNDGIDLGVSGLTPLDGIEVSVVAFPGDPWLSVEPPEVILHGENVTKSFTLTAPPDFFAFDRHTFVTLNLTSPAEAVQVVVPVHVVSTDHGVAMTHPAQSVEGELFGVTFSLASVPFSTVTVDLTIRDSYDNRAIASQSLIVPSGNDNATASVSEYTLDVVEENPGRHLTIEVGCAQGDGGPYDGFWTAVTVPLLDRVGTSGRILTKGVPAAFSQFEVLVIDEDMNTANSVFEEVTFNVLLNGDIATTSSAYETFWNSGQFRAIVSIGSADRCDCFEELSYADATVDASVGDVVTVQYVDKRPGTNTTGSEGRRMQLDVEDKSGNATEIVPLDVSIAITVLEATELVWSSNVRSFEAVDVDNLDDRFGDGDAVIITFFEELESLPIVSTMEDIGNYFHFSQNFAADLQGSWISRSQLQLDITTQPDITSKSPFIGELTFTYRCQSQILGEGTTTCTSPYLTGSWGTTSVTPEILLWHTSGVALLESQMSTSHFFVYLNQNPIEVVTLPLTVSLVHSRAGLSDYEFAEVAVEPSNLVFNAQNWDTYQRVNVSLVDDPFADDINYPCVVVGPPSGNSTVFREEVGKVKLQFTTADNESAGLTVSTSSNAWLAARHTDDDNNDYVYIPRNVSGEVSVTVTLGCYPIRSVTVPVALATADGFHAEWAYAQLEEWVAESDPDQPMPTKTISLSQRLESGSGITASSLRFGPLVSLDPSFDLIDRCCILLGEASSTTTRSTDSRLLRGVVMAHHTADEEDSWLVFDSDVSNLRIYEGGSGIPIVFHLRDFYDVDVQISIVTDTSRITVSDTLPYIQEEVTGDPYFIKLNAVDDGAARGQRELSIKFSCAQFSLERTIAITFIDNDVPGLTVAPRDAAGESIVDVATTEAGGQVMLDIRLTVAPSGTVAIDIESSDPSEIRVSPSTVSFVEEEWFLSLPATVTLSGVADDFNDGDKIVEVRIRLNEEETTDNIFLETYRDVEDLQMFTMNATNINVIHPEVTAIEPTTIPMSGASCNLTATGLATPARVFVDDMEVEVSAVSSVPTMTDLTVLSFECPPRTETGYHNVSIINGGTYRAEMKFARVLYYSSSCISEGTMFVSADGRSYCTNCTAGGYCPGGSRIRAIAGFWNEGEDSGFVAECDFPAEIRCVGGLDLAAKSVCAEGYHSYLCRSCDVGYKSWFGECRRCSEVVTTTSGFEWSGVSSRQFVFAAFLVVVCLVLAFCSFETIDILGWLLTSLQMFGALGWSLRTSAPSWTLHYYDALTVTHASVRFWEPNCVETNSPGDYLVATFAVIGCTIVLFVICLVLRLWIKLCVSSEAAMGAQQSETKFKRTGCRFLRGCLCIFALNTLSIATECFQLMACEDRHDGSYLTHHPASQCRDGSHITYFALSVTILIVVVLSILTTAVSKKFSDERSVGSQLVLAVASGGYMQDYGWCFIFDATIFLAIAAAKGFLESSAFEHFLLILMMFLWRLMLSMWMRSIISPVESGYRVAESIVAIIIASVSFSLAEESEVTVSGVSAPADVEGGVMTATCATCLLVAVGLVHVSFHIGSETYRKQHGREKEQARSNWCCGADSDDETECETTTAKATTGDKDLSLMDDEEEEVEDELSVPSVDKARRFRYVKSVMFAVGLPEDASIHRTALMGLSRLGRCGVAVELYFRLLRRTTLLFIVLTGATFGTLYNNWQQETVAQLPFSLRGVLGRVIPEIPTYYPLAEMCGVSIVCVIFLAMERRSIVTTARKNDQLRTTASDFSVHVKGIPRKGITEKDIVEHFSAWGTVLCVEMPRMIGRFVQLQKEEENARLLMNEEIAKAAASGDTESSGIMGAIEAWEQRRLDRKEATRTHSFDTIDLTGDAFVTFRTSVVAGQVLAEYHPGLLRQSLQLVSGTLGRILKALGGSDPLSKKKLLLHGKHRLRVHTAPEPSNVAWENLEVPLRTVAFREVITTIATGCFVALSFGIMYGITQEKVRLEEEATVEELLDEWSSPSVSIRGLAILGSVSITIVNNAIVMSVKLFSRFERQNTLEGAQKSIMQKMTLAQVCNTVLMVLIVHGSRRDSWYGTAGLANEVFYITLSNAFIPPILKLIDIPSLIRRHFTAKRCQTQAKMNEKYLGNEFDLAEWYSATLKTVALPLFYGPLVPITYGITVIAISLQYFAYKMSFLHNYRRPPDMNMAIAEAAREMWNMLILMHVALGFAWYVEDDMSDSATGRIPLYAAVGITVLYTLLPLQTFLDYALAKISSAIQIEPVTDLYHAFRGGRGEVINLYQAPQPFVKTTPLWNVTAAFLMRKKLLDIPSTESQATFTETQATQATTQATALTSDDQCVIYPELAIPHTREAFMSEKTLEAADGDTDHEGDGEDDVGEEQIMESEGTRATASIAETHFTMGETFPLEDPRIRYLSRMRGESGSLPGQSEYGEVALGGRGGEGEETLNSSEKHTAPRPRSRSRWSDDAAAADSFGCEDTEGRRVEGGENAQHPSNLTDRPDWTRTRGSGGPPPEYHQHHQYHYEHRHDHEHPYPHHPLEGDAVDYYGEPDEEAENSSEAEEEMVMSRVSKLLQYGQMASQRRLPPLDGPVTRG